MIKLLLFSLSLAAAPLTTTQLDQVRRSVANSGAAINFTKAQANTAAQNVHAWIEANRGALPNQITGAALTAGQRTAASTAMGGSFTTAQRAAFFDAVGAFNEIVVPPPPDKAADAKALAAVKAELLKTISAAIDSVLPGLSDDEKIRAIKYLLNN